MGMKLGTDIQGASKKGDLLFFIIFQKILHFSTKPSDVFNVVI